MGRVGDLELSPHPGQEGDAGTARRTLAIDLDELCRALNSRDPLGLGSHWLNLGSGEFLFLAEPDALDEASEDPRDAEHPAAQRETWFTFERQAMVAIARRWCELPGTPARSRSKQHFAHGR